MLALNGLIAVSYTPRCRGCGATHGWNRNGDGWSEGENRQFVGPERLLSKTEALLLKFQRSGRKRVENEQRIRGKWSRSQI